MERPRLEDWMLKPVFFEGPFELDKDREIGLDGGFPPSL
jgi:hypothetical protein